MAIALLRGRPRANRGIFTNRPGPGRTAGETPPWSGNMRGVIGIHFDTRKACQHRSPQAGRFISDLPPGPTMGHQSEARMSLIVVISVVWVEMIFFANVTASAFFPASTSVFAMTSALLWCTVI